MPIKKFFWIAFICLGVATNLIAQEIEGGDAPQILTTDLAKDTEVESAELKVSFVIVDTDSVTKVTIDGQPQKIEAGDTVIITKVFHFRKGKQKVRVEVEDEKGNKRVKTYRVTFGVAEKKKAEQKKSDFNFNVSLGAKYELDDNPTNDLSLPIDIGDVGNIQGVVNDEDQPDYRTTLNVVLSLGYKAISSYLGFINTSYVKEENTSLGSQVIFLGGLYNFSGAGKTGYQLGFTFMDINVGGNDFAQNITLAPGYNFKTQDEEGQWAKILSLDLVSKSYAGEGKDTGSQYVFKYNRNYKENNKLDSFKGNLALGLNSDGTEESEYTFLGYNADWKNQWNGGFRMDAGYGLQYRNYPNDKDILTDKLGNTRVDIPIRFSYGLGWQFTKDFSAMLNYRYVFDLSNDSPYVRQITGLAVKGTF